MDKDEEKIVKRFLDLANSAYKNLTYTCTDFLNEAELNLFYQNEKQFNFIAYEIFGGDEFCERKIIVFGSEEEMGYKFEYPIVCILVTPLIKKFADNLEHRDFLGALLNLGINRNKVGDIFVYENQGYIYCIDSIEDYVIENFNKIKHTNVKCEVVDKRPENAMPKLEVKHFIVSSSRLDSTVSAIYNMSRSKSLELIRGRKIFVNGKINENNSYILCNKDKVSVRGYGKFIYAGILGETRKNKENIEIHIYG